MNQITFDKINIRKYQDIYDQLIQKQIDVINNQLSYTCGIKLSKET